MHRRSLLAVPALLCCGPAHAQPYPTRPIRLVVPWAAGGNTSVIARIAGDEMAKGLGRPLVHDNRPGAGGAVGSDVVAKAAPDGYTILIAGAGTFYRHLLEKDTPYDPERDFSFIGPIGDGPFLLALRAGLPSTLRGFLDHARARPGALNFASAGQGSTSHLTAEMFNRATGIQAVHVPYRGSQPAMTDLIAGRIDYFFEPLASTVENVRAARIQGVAITTLARSPLLAEVPTLAEAGVPGFSAAPWWGLVGPAGMPAEAIARLSGELTRAVADAAVQKLLVDLGVRPFTMEPAAFETYVRAETAKWGAVIEAAGLRA
jgi:tripartite-type tricarboxylate transporter receptor subunit TctC